MSDPAPEPAAWRPSHSPWLVALSVLLATFMEVLDTSVANVSLSHIAGSLSASIDEATWALTSYLVANAIILPSAGWLSTRFGRKRYLAFSVSLFVGASALCGMAQTLPQLIIARVLQGLGGGGLQPLSQAVLLESFPIAKRGAAMAAYGMGIVVAPIIGPTLGGWLTDNYSWRWIFYINIPIGLLGLILQQLFVEDPPYIKKAKTKSIDYAGFGFMALGVGLLQLVLDKGQEADWFNAEWIRWCAAISFVALVVFVIWELRVREPLVNLRLLRDINYRTGIGLVAVLGAILYSTTVLLPIFMQTSLHYSALRTGLAMTPRGFGSMAAMIMMGVLIRRLDSRYLLMGGFLGIFVTCWILSNLNLEITQSHISWPLVFNGLSMGFIFVPLTMLTMSTLKQHEMFQATGLFALLRNIGGGFGISIIVTIQNRLAQAHQSVLVANLTPYSHEFQSWLQQKQHSLPRMGSAKAAMAMAYHDLLSQAALLSFVDCFRWVALTALFCAPLVWLFRKPKGPVSPVRIG
ncbi:MAG: DHA2 family efflux MFS transporter permease subunit [Pseudomonadota bacterium]